MPKERSPNRDKAKEIYLQNKGQISLVDIALQLGVSEGTVRGWKSKDNWDGNGTFQSKNTERSKRKEKKPSLNNSKNNSALQKAADKKTKTNADSPFARPGNQNAVGHGAPLRNRNAERTGEFISIYLDDLSEEERNMIKLSKEIGIYDQLLIKAGQYTVQEKRIRKEIERLKNKPGGMNIKSVTTQRAEVVSGLKKNIGGADQFQQTESKTNTEAVSVADEIFKREQALVNIIGKHAKILVDLAKLEQTDEKLQIHKQDIVMRIEKNQKEIDTGIDSEVEINITIGGEEY